MTLNEFTQTAGEPAGEPRNQNETHEQHRREICDVVRVLHTDFVLITWLL